MLMPLVDVLRCPKQHAETWLVASVERAEQRDIIEGLLGCPECMSEYPIRDGVVYFDEAVTRGAPVAPDETQAMRLAAALDLTDTRMLAVLHGDWGAHAMVMRGIAPVPAILVNPPRGVTSGDGISVIVGERVAFAQASIDAVAIAADASSEMTQALCRALRAGRRLVAPSSSPVPPDFTELARDDELWVAQLDTQATISAPIMPTRRAR